VTSLPSKNLDDRNLADALSVPARQTADPADDAQEGAPIGELQGDRAESIFFAWLISLPEGADVLARARVELARLDAATPPGQEPGRLRELFRQATVPVAPRNRARGEKRRTRLQA